MEDIPENLNFELRMKDGIVNVFYKENEVEQTLPLPYPDLETFTVDFSHLLALIADGPT